MMNNMSTTVKEQKTKPREDPKTAPLLKHYRELLAKCISSTSPEAADARYALNLLDQELRTMGLHATIKIGIEKIK
jgi:streptomycin 6-kinase